jgi:nucleotide-binding universal stress UspA family protein
MLCSAAVTVVPKLRNILFATDFSHCAEAALPFARALAQQQGATLYVAHVVPTPVAVPLEAAYPESQDETEIAWHRLFALTNSEACSGIRCTEIVAHGNAKLVLSRLVGERDIDLIVIGTQGRTGLEQFIDGSVAEYVFRRAGCPVLTVGPRVRMEGWPGGRLRTLLYATDFLSESSRALRYAVALSRKNHARLILCHALATVARKYLDEAVAAVEERFRELLPEHPDFNSRMVVASGPVAEVIVETAQQSQADMIVMGTHPSASPYLPWATAHKVVCQASCPVLTVRS